MTKRRKNLGPRRKRLNQAARLQAGKRFIEKHDGKHIIASYRKHFGVSPLCAALELRMLGCRIEEDTIRGLQMEEVRKSERRKQRKKEIGEFKDFPDSDERFAYIADYTSGGFPIGITWEEWEALSDIDFSGIDEEDEENEEELI